MPENEVPLPDKFERLVFKSSPKTLRDMICARALRNGDILAGLMWVAERAQNWDAQDITPSEMLDLTEEELGELVTRIARAVTGSSEMNEKLRKMGL